MKASPRSTAASRSADVYLAPGHSGWELAALPAGNIAGMSNQVRSFRTDTTPG